jgi:hypothetical protein
VATNQKIDMLIKDDQERYVEHAVHFGIGHSVMKEIICHVRCWEVYCHWPECHTDVFDWDAGKFVVIVFPLAKMNIKGHVSAWLNSVLKDVPLSVMTSC